MTMTRLSPVLLYAAAAFALAGCAANAQSASTDRPIQGADDPACMAAGDWFAPATKRTIATQNVIADLKAARVVLMGETHVIPDHHRWHMQTVAQLYAQRPDMVLGFETFPRRLQGVLDDWVAGKLTEEEFLLQSEWDKVWRYDAKLYLPLFHFARINRIPMVALNVDREFTSRVSKEGWNAIPKGERLGLGDPAPAPDAYVTLLGASFGAHGNGNGGHNGKPQGPGLSDPRFKAFVDVQLTWDRAMAEAIAAALEHKPTAQMVAVIGRGHLDYGYGVPHQLDALGVQGVKTLTPWDGLRTCDELTDQGRPVADLVFGLATTKDYLPQPPDGPKLGVMIETATDGVHVKGVVPDSIAEKTGIQTDDVIVKAADKPMAKTQDLVTVVSAMQPGTWLPLTVKRAGKDIDLIARFPVKPEDKAHP